jgi:hypothetical protein
MLLAPQAAARASHVSSPLFQPTTQRTAAKSGSRHFIKAASRRALAGRCQRCPSFGSRARIGPTAVRAFSRMEHPARAGWLSLRRGGRPPVHCGKSISPMSAVGQSRPWRSKPQHRACPLRSRKRTSSRSSRYVRLVPIPDMSRCSKLSSLFNHFAGGGEQRRRHRNAKRLRGLEVDH